MKLPSNALRLPFQLWLLVAVLVSSAWQRRFAKTAPDEEQKSFHRALSGDLLGVALWILSAHVSILVLGRASEAGIIVTTYGFVVSLFVLAPLIGLIRNVQKFNFLQIGRQRNLIYAVFATFLALLYLGFIRWVLFP